MYNVVIAVLYAMLIFVRMQNCVKWHMDSCLSVQNTQKITKENSILYKAGGDIRKTAKNPPAYSRGICR